jgi:serine/threonine-protein kinase
MQSSWEPDFFVADWRVRPALGKLERGEVSLALEPRTMQVLVCLARHAPEVVSKKRLMEEVWGEDVYVTDEVMSHAVWELRKAFGDEARNPRYIETFARKGYRLVAEVSRAVPPELLKPGSRVGQYEIMEPVASGAMGEVYKARDTRLGRTVALKVLPADLARDPASQKRFKREAQAVAQLDHPNVATIYDLGETEGGRSFLALAFYEGETLRQKLERGPLPIPEAVGIARQIAKGLAAAHRCQIVHRDIKPANLVVLPDGSIKILDFGLAKMTDATLLTRLGSSPGTPAYKSPEQTRGEPADPRSDLWALGVVLYEMVSGRVPFGGEYEQAIIYSILNEPMRPLDPSVPAALVAVIERALDKEAEKRYQTAEEMEADLGAMASGREGEVGRWKQSRKMPAVWRWIAAALIFAAVVGIVVNRYIHAHRWDFSRAVAVAVERGDQLEWRGDTERNLGSAEQAYRRALEFDKENPIVKAYLAALLIRIQTQFPEENRIKEIQKLTLDAVNNAPDHPMPWVAQAKLLILENDPKGAAEAGREAVKQGPEFDRGYTVLGESLILQKQLEPGLEMIRKGIQYDRGYLRGRLVLATKLWQDRQYEAAAIEFKKVLDIEPYQSTALYGLGEIYLETNQEDEALPRLHKALELDEWRAANSLGNLYLKKGERKKAYDYFSKAFNETRNPYLARNLAETYEINGQSEDANRWYRIALDGFDQEVSKGGSKADLLCGRSFCAAKLDRFNEAISNIEKAMELKPNDNRFLFRAAQVYFLAGRREETFVYLREAVQKGFSRVEIRSNFVFQPLLNEPEFRAILEGN